MTFIQITDEGMASLIGKNESGTIIWEKPIPIEGINKAKSWVNCKKNSIQISWQMPFNAFEFQHKFKWDGSTVTKLQSLAKDPSQSELDAAVEKATNGSGVEWDLDIMYPNRYITSYTIENLISKGHKNALLAYRSKNNKKAAGILENVFDLSSVMASIMGFCETCWEDLNPNTKVPVKLKMWLSNWKAVELNSELYIPALNDYGFFLQENTKFEHSIAVLIEVIKTTPNRAVAHLNIADSYWSIGHKETAKKYYKSYSELMINIGKKKGIPKRVLKRI